MQYWINKNTGLKKVFKIRIFHEVDYSFLFREKSVNKKALEMPIRPLTTADRLLLEKPHADEIKTTCKQHSVGSLCCHNLIQLLL
jgi:hypothetical protein